MSSKSTPKLTLSPRVFWDLGLREISGVQAADLLTEFYKTLELRVGLRLAERLDDNQLKNLDLLIRNPSKGDPTDWLEKNCPGYRDVVRQEYHEICNALKQLATDVKPSASARKSREAS